MYVRGGWVAVAVLVKGSGLWEADGKMGDGRWESREGEERRERAESREQRAERETREGDASKTEFDTSDVAAR